MEILILLFVILVVFLIWFIAWLSVEITFKIKHKLNHTIFKEKYINDLINNIEEGIKFNNHKINLYKDIKDEYITNNDFEEHCCICRCCDNKFYISEGIDEQLVDEFKQSELEAHRLYEVYSEQQRKENVKKRVEFIEEELKYLKKESEKQWL